MVLLLLGSQTLIVQGFVHFRNISLITSDNLAVTDVGSEHGSDNSSGSAPNNLSGYRN